MSAASFSFHPATIEEAIFAARWYRERSPLAATRFVAELNQTIDRILPLVSSILGRERLGVDAQFARQLTF
jgi:hypothetical protein